MRNTILQHILFDIKFCYCWKKGKSSKIFTKENYKPIGNQCSQKINCFTLLGCIADNIEIVGNNLYGEPRLVENHGSCIEECKKTQRCVAWTLKEGFCYLKNESGILRTGGTLTYSGSKNCNDTKGMSHS